LFFYNANGLVYVVLRIGGGGGDGGGGGANAPPAPSVPPPMHVLQRYLDRRFHIQG